MITRFVEGAIYGLMGAGLAQTAYLVLLAVEAMADRRRMRRAR